MKKYWIITFMLCLMSAYITYMLFPKIVKKETVIEKTMVVTKKDNNISVKVDGTTRLLPDGTIELFGKTDILDLSKIDTIANTTRKSTLSEMAIKSSYIGLVINPLKPTEWGISYTMPVLFLSVSTTLLQTDFKELRVLIGVQIPI